MFQSRLDRIPVKFLAQEHEILRELRRHSASERPMLVAVSGGEDSVVLLHVLNRLRPVLKSQIFVAHIHHGEGTAAQVSFRNKAQKFVQAEAKKLGLPFFSSRRRSVAPLRSEAELREYRFRELNKISDKIYKKINTRPILALGHHQDDQVETQMMRLIRGTGLIGLRGIEYFSEEENKIRPLLFCSKKEVSAIARKLKLKWCEDPSNKIVDPLRNWLRHSWLPALEKKSPGGRASLARSFELVLRESSSVNLVSAARTDDRNGIERKQFLELSRDQKAIRIARYLRQLKIKHYTQGQIEEVCRRLDNRRVKYTFTLLKHEWRVDARRIQALKL